MPASAGEFRVDAGKHFAAQPLQYSGRPLRDQGEDALVGADDAVNPLIKHDKPFDLLVVPGMGHGAGGTYGEHKRYDFFVQHLLGVAPPSWKSLEVPKAASEASRPPR